MEPKEYGEEIIEHPNLDLGIRTIHFHMSSKYQLRFGFLGRLFGSTYLQTQGVWKPRV